MLRVLGIFVWLLALGCYAGVAKAVDVDADVYQRMIEQGYVSKDDVKIYKNIFKYLKENNIEDADDAAEDLNSDLLLGHVLAEKYLSKNYKTSFDELKDWLSQYADLPQARRIYRLALKKGDKSELALPDECQLEEYSTSLLSSESPAYAKLSPKNRDFVVKQVKKFYRYLNKGKTRAARNVLEGKKFRMTIPDKYWDELSVKLAFMYLIDNYDKLALEWAQKPARRSKSATAYWVAGLASWKMKKYQQAAGYFEKLGALKDNDEWLEAAGAFWAFRANMKLNRKQKAAEQLKVAAKYSRTFYGILAAYALGQKIEYNWDETPFWNDFSNPQYAAGLVESPYIRRAVALYHAKQPRLADQEIENGYAEMDGWEDANKRPLLVPNPADPSVYRLGGRRVVYADNDLIPDETSKMPIYAGNFKSLGTLFVRKGIEMASTDVGGDAWATDSYEIRGLCRLAAVTMDKNAAFKATISAAAG